ncbi:MAG: helix-turn-helix domain-containing protein [Armatimonadetes bacterium]|nr:helix-turn-helix domain-containing protein [Armatimonadota bacterium]
MNTEKLEIRSNIYYTPEEAATLLRVSRRSILKLLENGMARGVKIGRQWRILGNDLLQLPAQDDVDDRALARAFIRLSEPAFKRVWDNEEDAVYDNL